MKKIMVLSMVLLLMGFAAVAQAYTTTEYFAYLPSFTGDPGAFTTACPDPAVENFQDAILMPGLSISEVGGAGTIALGVYQNTVDIDVPRSSNLQLLPRHDWLRRLV